MSRQNDMYCRRKNSGLCVSCAIKLDDGFRFVRCDSCRRKDTNKSKKYYRNNGKLIRYTYQKNRIQTRKTHSLCITCGISCSSDFVKCHLCRKVASESQCKYVKTNLKGKLISSLRSRLRLALKGKRKNAPFMRLLGCSVNELKIHLESKFQVGMSWENYGKWHIDHIKPLSKFNLNDPQQLQLASHYSNLQPLWAKDNLSKYNKEL